MVDPRTSIEGIHEYIREVKATVILTLDVAYPKIQQAIVGTEVRRIIMISPAESLPPVKKRLYLISKGLKNGNYTYGNLCQTWQSFIKNGEHVKPAIAPYTKDSCCVIVHTGGTTGVPKGVMLSNENLNALVKQSILTGINMRREHTWMDIMPPFIAYGIGMGICLPLVIGMETILIPSFDPKKFDELLLKYKPMHMVFVPSYWGTIIHSRKLRKKNLSYIIAPTVGGDRMDPELEKAANQFLLEHGCSYQVTKGYGMTEVCAGVTGTLDANNELGSVGVPFVKSTVAIFDPETGVELPYNQLGEVCISGPNVMLGYYQNESATNEIIRIHNDGKRWVHSGDIGYMNERGSLFIMDRIKRMIVRYDGFKVFPSMVEKAIAQHPSVEQCCVVGAVDREHSQGHLPAAFVVLNENNQDKVSVEYELENLCLRELPEYAQPVEWHFRDSLPLTPIGKIDYRALEEMAKEM
jgi:long-chain acyl-CoA synthetase